LRVIIYAYNLSSQLVPTKRLLFNLGSLVELVEEKQTTTISGTLEYSFYKILLLIFHIIRIGFD
jgi:hypothetical protein